MKHNQYYQSFASRLTKKVLAAVLFIMAVTLTISFILSYRGIRGETIGRYVGMMNMVSEKIQEDIRIMEIGAMNAFDEVEHHLDSPESVEAALEKEIRLNDNVEGYFVAFEPDYFPQRGRWFEPYAHKQGDEKYIVTQVGSQKHDYLKTSWYERAKKERNVFWTDPYSYYDETGYGGVFCTFVKPIIGKDGRLIGVCGADLLLEKLTEELKTIDVDSKNLGMQNIDERYRHLKFYSFIINNDGTYIAHPDKKRVLKEKIYSHVGKNILSEESEPVIRNITQQKNGINRLVVDGVFADVYYTPVESTSWSLVTVAPKRALVQPLIILFLSLLCCTGLGQLLVWYVCRRNIRKATKPLEALTNSAEEVAKGNFSSLLPELEYKDEICQLRDSFDSMQHSLVRYVHDLEETTAKKASLESELTVARTIQMSMIPNKFPPFPKRNDIDIFGSLTPAKSVGGDLFDYFIRDEHLYFCIGDVSGKGVPAALMMTVAHYLFRSVTSHCDQPDRIVEIMNDSYSADNKTMMFCTFFIGILDLKTGLLQYCNAGHEAPFIINSKVERMTVKANIALGIMPGMAYPTQEIQLPSGTLLFFYTDGLTDATNEAGEQFGIERVTDLLRKAHTDQLPDATSYIQRVTSDLGAFVKEAAQADDLTLLAIKIKYEQ